MKQSLILLAALAWAQDEAPTFRSTTRLVEASVSVVDGGGRPVADLTRDDFVVKAGGRVRPVAFLQFDGAPGGKRDTAPLPKYVYTNRPEFQPA